jgi:hypothetical protein
MVLSEFPGRIVDIHKFSILNEPDELILDPSTVNQWTIKAYSAVRESGFKGSIVISDGLLPPSSYIGIFSQTKYPG